MSQQAKVKKKIKKKETAGVQGAWHLEPGATHSTGSSNVRMLLLSSLSIVQS